MNDVLRKQLLLLDTAFNTIRIVADSTPGSENAYGPSQAGMLPYPGDSTLFVLPRVPSMYMIDPTGKIVKVYKDVDPEKNSGQVLADIAALKKGGA